MDKITHVKPPCSHQLIEVLRNGYITPSLESPLAPDSSISGITAQEKLSLFYSIVNQSTNAVVITNADKDIIYVNKKFEALSGYALTEVLGKNPRVLKSNKTPAGTYRDMHRKLQSGQTWKGVFINVHRNGDEYVEEAVITPVTNEVGDIICYLAEKKDITKLRDAKDCILKLTHYDSLTELPNRAYFIEEASMLINFPPNDNYSFAILVADLDRFKELNDTNGHLAGDMALQEVARRIEKALPPGNFVARVGGDEFAVIHRQATSGTTAELAARLSGILNQAIILKGQKFFLGVSIGSSIWPHDGEAWSDIMANADLAMYKAKLLGQSFIPYTDLIGSSFHRTVELSHQLSHAIYNNQLYLVYQPKYDLVTGKMMGVEALLRWESPTFGSVDPAEFIPIAEKCKMMRPVGKWVIMAACEQIHQWKSEGVVLPGNLAVNISVQQIEHPDFLDGITNLIVNAGLSPSMFELEVTESVLMSDPNRAMHVLKELTARGFCISIDDFGAGFSSLSYLKKLDAKILKIDKSFIDNITTSTHDQVIVKSIVNLAQNLGLSIIAEGVETKEQAQHLMDIGCNAAQGFYYSKPITAEALKEMILLGAS